jgi:lysophospholipase I
VFWGHGTDDPQVDHEFSRSCAAALASDLGIPFRVHSGDHQVGAMEGLDFHSYEGLGHWFNNDELNDLKTWIKGRIPGPSNRDSVGSLEACAAKFPGKFV